MTIKITEIIEKYKNDVYKICGSNEKEIFESFYCNINTEIIHDWVQKTFETTSIKNGQKSLEFRIHGNNYFNEGQIDNAFKNYTKSLNYANYDSENFYLAIANRSAIFFAQNKYECCINDINMCLNKNYPEHLKYNLQLRLVNCYKELSDFKNAEKSIDILKKYVDSNLDNLGDKKDQILGQIKVIEDEVKQKSNLQKIENYQESDSPIFEENPKFTYASNKINLKYDPKKGRHVIATQNLKTGETIFIEKPFSFVPIFGNETKFCYHCFKITENLYPCKNCSSQFCSYDCFETSFERYHRFECTGSCVDIWPMVGVNFLANRILLLGATSGYKNVFNMDQKHVEIFGNKANNYDYVCSLVNNIEKMDKVDVFPHVVSSILITTYLSKKTNFFEYVSEFLEEKDITSSENRDKLFILIGSVLLKHILQVIANASSIETVENDFYKNFNSLEQINNSGLQFLGVGMFPSVSMMNHSCSPNITNYFINDYIVVKTKCDIKIGEEIFNCYGYDSTKHATILRQEELKKQHFFDCNCVSCTFPTEPEMYKDGLLCQTCNNLCLPNENIYKCIVCNHNFDPTNHFLYINKAERFYKKYKSNNAIELLKKCFELRKKVFYKYNLLLYTTNLDLQNDYGKNGDIKNWLTHTNNILDLDQKILGLNSLRSALNIRTFLLILLRYLHSIKSEDDISEITLLDLLSTANNMVENMKNIFSLYYNQNKINFNEIEEFLKDATMIVTLILREKYCTNKIENICIE